MCLVGVFIAVRAQSREAAGAVILLWTLWTVLYGADLLVKELYLSPRLHVFNHLPVPDDRIFQLQWRRFLGLSLWSVLDFSILYLVLLDRLGGFSFGAAIALGSVHCLFATAVAVCLHGLAPGRHFSRLGMVFLLLAIAVLFLGSRQFAIAAWLNRFAAWVPPVGWVQYALGNSPRPGLVPNLWACLAGALVLGLAPMAYRGSRRSYSLREAIFALARRFSQTTDPGEPIRPRLAPGFVRSAAEIKNEVQSREFLAGLRWQGAGLVERAVFLVLSPRERLLAEFTLAANPAWTRDFRSRVLLLVGIVAAVKFFVPGLGGNAFFLTFALIFLLPGASTWRAFLPARGNTGLQTAPYAFYPAGFWELARMVVKVNVFQFLLWLPFALGALWVVGGIAWFQGGPAASVVIKLIALNFISQPVLVLLQFSPGTNDTDSPLVVLVTIVVVVALATSGVTFFVATNPAIVLGAFLASASFSTLCLLVYGHLFNRNHFDLVPKAPGR